MNTLAHFSGLLRLAALFFAFIPNSNAQTLPDYLPTEGLVGWWPFNGNANDESGNGNHGVVNGATLSEDRDGNPNAAYSFDGVDDIISCAGVDAISGAQQLSVSMWFKTESTTDLNRLLGQENTCNQINSGFAIAFGSADAQTLRFLLRNGANQYGFIPNNEIPMGIWNQILLVYDGLGASDLDKCKVYLNGCLQVLTIMNGPLPSTLPFSEIDTPFEIGASTCNGSENFFFDGALDDIAIYNRALTPEEVTALYTGALDFPGCTYADACNYDAGATVDDGSCTFPSPNYDCAGNCLLDLNNNGVCDDQEVYGCTYLDALNYDALATADDGSCLYTCKGDFNGDAIITVEDLVSFLASYGNSCEDAGCQDENACNYNPDALYSDGSCTYSDQPFLDCVGNCLNDADGDGVCDELEVAGCTDPAADNYNPEATDEDGSCLSLSGLQVGDVFGGGLVAYIYQTGDPGFIEGEVHGFVVSDFNLTNNIAWGCSGTFMETSSELGAGMANTIQIVNACSDENFAAKLCYDLIHNGYDDWWLPSRDELAKIYGNRVALDIASALHYWSSTDCSELRARVLNFANGGWFNCSSHTTNRKVLSPYSNGSDAVRRVRAIRYF